MQFYLKGDFVAYYPIYIEKEKNRKNAVMPQYKRADGIFYNNYFARQNLKCAKT